MTILKLTISFLSLMLWPLLFAVGAFDTFDSWHVVLQVGLCLAGPSYIGVALIVFVISVPERRFKESE
jgi:hypothetical protein